MDAHSKHDARLLESEFLAVVVVKCEDRKWNLHKVILVSRPEWFKKALCGDFTEAKTNDIVLVDQDINAVDWMIRWINTSALDPSIFEAEDTAYESYVLLARCADFFLLDDLRQLWLDRLRSRIREKATWAQKAFNTCPDHRDQVRKKDIVGLLKGAAKAYELNCDITKEAFLEFLKLDHYCIMVDHQFVESAKAIPAFWHDALERGHAVFMESPLNFLLAPWFCVNCQAEPFAEDGFYWATVWCEGAEILATCGKCFEAEA
ncbi:Uu.00g123980.m01.CDS01 [Anthostomella pinea]|uniref:Uu.00g123980.m01.CDS01 n=1 Tax=Anthostomella pinea TaxID=933095 RepID=A0AAI8VII6_9PEZI|nr:Uu.00g123980.m01.CDS01 [Anthostomella pinea]